MINCANHDDQLMIHNSANQVTFHPRWADQDGTHQILMKMTIRMMKVRIMMMILMTILKIIFQTEAVRCFDPGQWHRNALEHIQDVRFSCEKGLTNRKSGTSSCGN